MLEAIVITNARIVLASSPFFGCSQTLITFIDAVHFFRT